MIAEIGRLTQDVELKTVEVDGEQRMVVNNNIAINNGKDRSAFLPIAAWGKLAEFMAAHFRKGDELYIEGFIGNRDYYAGSKTIAMPFVIVERVKFTHGNRREQQE